MARLKANKPLKAKSVLKAKVAIKVKPKKRKYVPFAKKTARQLMPIVDVAFSKYVRIRDSEYTDGQWIGECIDGCMRKLVVIDKDGKWNTTSNNGHFISRGVLSLRYDETNTNLQSAYCNAWRDKEDMLEGYRKGLEDKYGKDTVKELKRLSKLPDAYKLPSKPELLQILKDSQTQVEWILKNRA